jgi:hypothetical protein
MSNWHHVCLKCAEGREYKPIGGLPKMGPCPECGAPLGAGGHLVEKVEVFAASTSERVAAAALKLAAGCWAWGTSPCQIEDYEDDREAAVEAARQRADEGATVYVWRAEAVLAGQATAGAAAPIAPAAQPTEPVAGSWGWGTSPDQIDGREDDRDAAIEAAREQAEDGATVYVWAQLRDVDPAKYVPNAERIVEAMGDRAYDNQPESMQGEPWPNVTTEQMAELEALLEPIREWARKCAKSWWVADGEAEAVPPDGAK